MGVEVNTARVWNRAEELELSRVVFVNMLDRERADFFRTLTALQEQLSDRCVAIQLPIGAEHELTGIVDLLHNCAYMDPGGAREGDPVPIPDELADLGRRVPREAARRRRRDRRGADGALPRRRGARPARRRGGAQDRGHERRALSGRLRRRDEEPRHAFAARPARRGRAVAGAQAAPRSTAEGTRRSSSRPSPTRSPAASRLPRLRGHGLGRLDADELARPREGAARRADGAAGQGARAGRRLRRGRHRRRREAEGRADRRRARRPRARRRAAEARRSPSR